ncbi:LysM domain-containing protein [Streptomyces sp. TLI_55]|uniref:LysM peptidoglycan-binding domain-containing protein n=1 Tax=Streptomyces sp. TLI_55 TaxID=1938861 RepID=UPI000BDBF4EA|nr:LysM peptidoglycan-binding domain-containing protein [Streptomyces sp. TLI_55]SNX88480.1 LysM domain-containing protein [Streptomyces sp. TLI_55]
MRTTPSPAATAGRTLARIGKAVLSLLTLTAAVAGLPLLLAWATPVIWAATHDDAMHLLDRQDTGGVFLLLLVAVGWIGWAQFAFCTVRELVAQVRGRTWHAPRGMGASQRAAALLIGSIIVLLPTSSALASDAQAAPTSTAARIPGQPQSAHTSDADPAATAAANTPVSGSSIYTVRETRPAQSLWGIAEKELGDGERWREIAALNEGATMADGTVFHANSFLQPGWQLQMPENAASPTGLRTQLDAGPAAAGEKGEHVVTVQAGDYLSKIAEDELGDGGQWPELFEASKDRPQPHGLPEITNPDMIHPGQQVTIPAARPDKPAQDDDQGDAPDGTDTTAPPAQDGDKHTSEGQPDEPAPAPSQATTPAPSTTAPSTPSTSPGEHPEQERSSPPAEGAATPKPTVTTAPSAAAPPAATPHASDSAAPSPAAPTPAQPVPAPSGSGSLNLRIVLGAGALLAAAITSALALRRTLQRRRRKPGETIAIVPETSPAEAQLAQAAEPAGAARLDVVLRTLAHHVDQDEDTVLPPLRAARIGARTVEVLPEDLAQDPVTPFVSGQAGWWSLPADAVLLDEQAARDVAAPYPGLVTIGTTEAGDLLLINLAQLPALLLDGNPVHITEVCTSLALELGMSPWAEAVEVITVGFGEDLPHLLPTARIAHMRQATHALRDLSERLLEAHQMPETQHQPYLMLCASALDPDTAWQLADLIDRAQSVPVTLIAPASSAAPHFPEAEILNASLSEPQTIDHVGADVTVQRLEHAAYVQITTALQVSGQQADPAEGPWQDVPDELDNLEQPGKAEPHKPAVPAISVASSPAQTAGAEGTVYSALLAASADPSGARLLTSATASPASSDPAEEASADTDTAVPSAPASGGETGAPAPASGAETAETLLPESTPKLPAEPEDEGSEARDLHVPEIRVLGPVEVTGIDSTGHGPRMAQLAALLFFRPGRSADALCSDMDPVSPWSTSTLNARLQGLRSSLGSDSSGNLYVPRRKSGEDPYRLAPGIRCDWSRFLQLAERALPLGPTGLEDLEKALTLVRGKPFGGRPLPWAEPFQQEMITRIIDVAHTVATYRIPQGPHHDLSAAHRAVSTGLDVDDTAELLYRDWMRLEAARGNRSGLHTAITRVQQVNRVLDCSLETETTQLIHELLNGSAKAVRRVP